MLAAVAAQVPPGYKTYENKNAPLHFCYPVIYQEVPLPPTEQLLVARFLAKESLREQIDVEPAAWRHVEPELLVFRFERPAAVTGAGAGAGSAPANQPTTVREAMEAAGRITSWTQFVQRLPQWRLDEEPKKPGVFRLAWKGRWGKNPPVGHLVRIEDGSVVYGVLGTSFESGEDRLRSHVTKVAASLEPAALDDAASAAAAIDRLYASGKFRAVEFRKAARKTLAQGWKALDTENYLIVHHSKNEALIRQIAREIEAMRAFYAELFPPQGTMDALSVVRVCRTRDEYHQYGGPANTGGYWHPGNEELVFFDYSYTMKTLDKAERKALGNEKLTDEDSLLVLYHEAFHQYIHYAVGEISPHDWFNEGYGDYFSGAVVGESKVQVQRIDPSPWRIHLAKDMCEFGDGFVPLEEILKAERAVFYNPARIRYFYAGAWSFVHFLKHDKAVAAHPQWSRLLAVYFDTLKAAYGEELGKSGDQVDLAKKQLAGALARKRALAKTLEGIDLPALEKAWRHYVVTMKDPWPQLRKKRK